MPQLHSRGPRLPCRAAEQKPRKYYGAVTNGGDTLPHTLATVLRVCVAFFHIVVRTEEWCSMQIRRRDGRTVRATASGPTGWRKPRQRRPGLGWRSGMLDK